MDGRRKKLAAACLWRAKWGSQLVSKYEWEKEDKRVREAKRKELEEWCSLNHITREETENQLSMFDTDNPPLVQPCFQEQEYGAFTLVAGMPSSPSSLLSTEEITYDNSPTTLSLCRALWEMYRRLDGHRTFIIIPMGGAIPGSIPVMVAYEYLELEGFDKEDADHAISIWEEMDRIANEQRDKLNKKSS